MFQQLWLEFIYKEACVHTTLIIHPRKVSLSRNNFISLASRRWFPAIEVNVLASNLLNKVEVSKETWFSNWSWYYGEFMIMKWNDCELI